ncbi:MAG TPA: 23S rRNA (guanosine(2251)-2'-O)-methyltransferase RlmB [Solirubrobacteraceae bacterium]|nr:23S rRNA (guanosine(2251)-2'-O)-methyltransferase RlmB [Solirubrobacteraceae bacterium]
MELVYGKHSVRAVFLTRPQDVRRLILGGKPSYHDELVVTARRAGVEPEFMAWPDFRRLTGLTDDDKHQGVCVFTKPRRVFAEHELDRLANGRLVIALDQISDPQNLGAVLRSAAFFRADAVLLLKNRSAELTPKVARIAVGGAELVEVFRVTNLARSLDILRELGYWVYGLDERGERTLRETEFDPQSVLVVGAEGQGLRQRTRTKCDALVRIPGGREGVESLNAAVATAVALAEIAGDKAPPSGAADLSVSPSAGSAAGEAARRSEPGASSRREG